ncbi:HAD family hydrolase [soil metagenome]
MTDDSTATGVLLDLDGTLVDSVFHHVIAWDRALRDAGLQIPLWRIHAGIGMGSERLVPWLLGRPEADHKPLADAHEDAFLEQAANLRQTPGAADLVEDLRQRAVPFRVATSAGGAVSAALLEALGVGDPGTIGADDVGAPKPAPDLLLAGCEELGLAPERVTIVGDSPWDAEAAQRIGMRTIAVRCGGFGDDVLRGAGAADVVDDPRALIGRL